MKRIFGRRFHQFDVFPKTNNDILIRSKAGGLVTIIVGLILVYLALSEFYDYIKWEPQDELLVDVSRDKIVDINFDIVFYGLKCRDTQIDVVDELGEQRSAITHNIEKIKVDRKTLEHIMSAKVARLGDIESKPFPDDYCGPCSPGATSDKCCNSCDQVQAYYKDRGLPLSEAFASEQCVKENEYNSAHRSEEGCKVRGTAQVKKVRGNFHVAPGVSGDQNHGGHSHHVHQISRTKLVQLASTLDLNHRVNHLSFGPVYPGMINPLDGHEKSIPGLVRHTYFLQVVPTEYNDGWGSVETHQYSVTNHTEQISLDSGHVHLPGVFFKYDFSPILVRLHGKTKSFSHFLTRLCAVIGGIWVSIGIVFNMSRRIADMSKKKE